MSKTVDDLAWIYLNAFAEEGGHDIYAINKPGQRTIAGIAAVIRALRDEMVREFERCDSCSGIEHVEPFFEEILGDAGNEKVAGSTPKGAVLSSSAEGEPPASPATDFIPCAVCGPHHSWGRPERCALNGCAYSRENTAYIIRPTDPAPAVCEWTPLTFCWSTSCGRRPHNAPFAGYPNCACGLPIKFTEAKT